jgi:hypothetical protein
MMIMYNELRLRETMHISQNNQLPSWNLIWVPQIKVKNLIAEEIDLVYEKQWNYVRNTSEYLIQI